MTERKIIFPILYMMFFFMFITACTDKYNNTELEEGSKVSKIEKSETETSETETVSKADKGFEKPIDKSKRKQLKEDLTIALDDFLISDISGVATRLGTGYLPDMQMTINRAMYQGEYLYLIDTRSEGDIRLTFENSKEAYVSMDGGSSWGKVLDMDTVVREGPGSMSGYVTYICLMYAALDAGKECTYDIEKNVYHIELDSDDMMALDLYAIKSTIENKDRFNEFNIYLNDSEIKLKSYKMVTGSKRYEFGFQDKNVFVKEETGEDKEAPDFSAVWIRTIIDETGPIEEMDVIKMFEEIRSQVK